MLITSKTDQVTTCDGCGATDRYFTYKIERGHYCKFCATQKIYKKNTKVTTSLVEQFENGVDYASKLELAENIIKNGVGTRKMRVSAAKIQTKIPLDIRNLGGGKYIILSPAGKRIFDAPNHKNDAPCKPKIDPQHPFESICDYVQEALNNGLPTHKVAEYIWSIRGKHDYITAMMYPDHVVVTWEHGQRPLKPC